MSKCALSNNIVDDVTFNSSNIANVPLQGAPSAHLPVMSSYQHRQPYLHPWTAQAMYTPSGASPVEAGPPLQYMYHGFQHPHMQGHQPVMQPVGNPSRMLNPSGLNMEYPMPGVLPRNVSNQGAPHTNHHHAPTVSHISGSFGREGSSGGSGGNEYGTPTASSATTQQQQSSTMPMQVPETPYYVPGSGPWAGWRGTSALSPLPFPINSTDQSIQIPYTPGNEAIRPGMVTTSNRPANDMEKYGESKKTLQRRAQRERKSAFKARSQQWPMKIQCTSKGDIPLDIRAFVHTQFRATARRFLNLSVIKFRDHPDADIKILKDDLDRRFTFEPPLRLDYILSYIESFLRTARYIWRKHWLNTGRGEKHKFCPLRFFPSLVCYWKTKEADEEAKLLKEEREAKKKEREQRLHEPQLDDNEPEEEWDVCILPLSPIMLICHS